MAVHNYDPTRSSTQSSVIDMSTSPESKFIGANLAAALIKVKADQEKRESFAEQPKTPGSLERKEALSPSSQAVESGDVTPGHEGVKRKDRKTWHQPPTGYFESTK